MLRLGLMPILLRYLPSPLKKMTLSFTINRSGGTLLLAGALLARLITTPLRNLADGWLSDGLLLQALQAALQTATPSNGSR